VAATIESEAASAEVINEFHDFWYRMRTSGQFPFSEAAPGSRSQLHILLHQHFRVKSPPPKTGFRELESQDEAPSDLNAL
jgi:hypothetical protein